MKKILIASAAAAVFASLSGLASAAGTAATTTFSVSLTIQSGCVVAASDVDLGSFPASRTLDVTSNGAKTINVTCTKGTPYTVGLQSTAANSRTDGTGSMAGTNTGTSGNTDTIPYALFQDASLNTPWGNVTGTGANVVAGTSTDGTTATGYGVYVKVLGSAITNRTADVYKDIIQVSVNY